MRADNNYVGGAGCGATMEKEKCHYVTRAFLILARMLQYLENFFRERKIGVKLYYVQEINKVTSTRK
jgi:hypothetical protein